MAFKLNCMAAVSSNGGIGYKGAIPWPKLETDHNFMIKKTSQTKDPKKENAVIFGRLTWKSIPIKHRPLPNRYNIVLSSRKSEEIKGAHLVVPSLTEAVDAIQTPPLSDRIESVIILGGEKVYEEAMLSPLCDLLWITEVHAEYPHDSKYPLIDPKLFSVIENPDDPLIPTGVIEEAGVKYEFKVYKRNY